MSERTRRQVVLAPLFLAGLAIGCGGARPTLPAGVDLDQLISTENVAFLLDLEPEGMAVAVEFDRAGERLLTAHASGEVILRDATEGRVIAELAVHQGGTVAAAFSSGGEAIATAGTRDGRVAIWDARTGEQRAICEAAATAIAWSPDGSRIAIGKADGTAAICEVATGKILDTVTHAAPVREGDTTAGPSTPIAVTAVAFSSDGSHLATAGTAGVVTFWSAEALAESRSDLGHTGQVRELVPVPGSDRIASVGEDGTVQILAPDRTEPVARFYNESVPLRCAAISADGARLAWGDRDGLLEIWDATSGERLAAIEAHQGEVNDLAWSPDGARLISAGGHGIVRVSDSESGGELLVATAREVGQLPGGASWSPDGARLAVVGSGPTLELWDPSVEVPGVRLSGPHQRPIAVAWSPDGRRLASGGRDESVRIWNAELAAFAGEIRGADGPVLDIEWSPADDRVAAVGWGGVHVFDAGDGQLVFAGLDHEGAVNRVAFSPDGERLATAGADGQVKVWSAGSGEEIKSFVTGATPVTALDWSADGERLAIGSDDGVVWIWSVGSGLVEETLEHPELGPVFGVDWGPDDARLAVVDTFGGLFTWTASGGSALELLARGAGAAWSVEWRPDGEYLLVCGSGGAWIHRLRDGARLTLSSYEENGQDLWLAFTDQGLFSGDERSFRKLTFRVKDDLSADAILPVEAMVDAFYREDLLVEFLAGEQIAPPGD